MNKRARAVIILLSMMVMTPSSQQSVISIAQGKITGTVKEGCISYYGIPYGSVQLPEGKFKRAGIAPSWTGIRDVRTCQLEPDENCLQLEVHVPVSDSSPWPVLVWVRSGPGPHDPSVLVKENVIVVLVSYRNGPNGFLCTKSEKIPGNAGAKDVVLALRWVRDNIAAFSGNPGRVTVAGQGFGAAIVEALTLSPMADDLFHGAILQSGTILSPSSFNYDADERARLLASSLGDYDEVKGLLAASRSELLALSEDLDFPYFSFGMCAENAYRKEERFLSEPPYEILSNGKFKAIPMIMGFNSNEGYIFASNLREATVLKKLAVDPAFILPEELSLVTESDVKSVVKKINSEYFDDRITMKSVLAYHRDAYFLNHVYRSVRMRSSSSSSPIYFYQFSYSGDRGVEEVPGVEQYGAAHSDELAYLFPEPSRLIGEEDGSVEGELVKLWTDFVKYLNPTPKQSERQWEAVNHQDIRLLDIGSTIQMKSFPYTRAVSIWDELFERYYYKRQRA